MARVNKLQTIEFPGGLGAWREDLSLVKWYKTQAANDPPLQMELVFDGHFDHKFFPDKFWNERVKFIKDNDVPVILGGDNHCAMGGKNDRRTSKADLHPAIDKSDYFDRVAELVAEKLEPIKDHIILVLDGNHETAVTRHQEINLNNRLLRALGFDNKRQELIRALYYSFALLQMKRANSNTAINRLQFYEHGSGKGGPVTGAAIMMQRTQSEIHGVDDCFSGHLHQDQARTFAYKTFCSRTGSMVDRYSHHINLPCLKPDSLAPAGWLVEKVGKKAAPVVGTYTMQYSLKRYTCQVKNNRTDRIEIDKQVIRNVVPQFVARYKNAYDS